MMTMMNELLIENNQLVQLLNMVMSQNQIEFELILKFHLEKLLKKNILKISKNVLLVECEFSGRE